ncbi:hypothetical protein P0R31_39860 [Bradyrhizobium yuanmingense]|nr:hypothetical protein [Bradyrhizobium yuanmingense]MDF0523339.1 hypothetical protein [Bradyrhizobium yuanmingense]
MVVAPSCPKDAGRSRRRIVGTPFLSLGRYAPANFASLDLMDQIQQYGFPMKAMKPREISFAPGGSEALRVHRQEVSVFMLK